MFLQKKKYLPLLFAFGVIVGLITLINPISNIDIVLLGLFLFTIGHVFLGDKMLLAFILIRPTLDWWRDYTLIQYHETFINLNAALAIALILWAPLFLYKYTKQIKKVPFVWLMTALTILMFGSSLYSHYPLTSIIESIKFVDILLLFIMSFIAIKEDIFTRKDLLTTILISAIVPVTAGLWQLITGGGITTFGVRGRIFGSFAHPNVFAFFLLFLLFLHTHYSTIAPTWFWKSHNKLRIATYVMLLVLLLMTYTRAAYVGLFIFIITIGLLRYKKVLYWTIGLCAGFYLVFFPLNTFIEKNTDLSLQNVPLISRITSRNEDADSIEWRQALVRETIPIIYRNPVFGYGYGTFPEVWEENRGERHLWDDSAEAHNDYLRLFLEIGALGLALYIVLLGFLVYYTIHAYRYKKSNQKQYTYLVGWIVVMVAVSLTDNMLHHTPVMWLMWAWFGAAFAHEYKYVDSPNFLEHV